MKKKTLKENARHGPKDSQQESKASYFKDCKDCSNCYQQSKQFDFCNKKKIRLMKFSALWFSTPSSVLDFTCKSTKLKEARFSLSQK
jgi:hypothetical protein